MTRNLGVARWTQERTLLPPDLTEAQLEAIRRAGARRRHIARVAAARDEVRALIAQICRSDRLTHRAVVTRLIRTAIEASIAQIGEPGSSSGTSPPSWYRNTRNVGARVAALREALDAEREIHHAERYVIHVPSGITPAQLIIADPDPAAPTIGWIDVRWGHPYAILAECISAQYIARQSAAVDAWLASGAQGPVPEPPPQEVIDFHSALVNARRARAAGLDSGEAEPEPVDSC